MTEKQFISWVLIFKVKYSGYFLLRSSRVIERCEYPPNCKLDRENWKKNAFFFLSALDEFCYYYVYLSFGCLSRQILFPAKMV